MPPLQVDTSLPTHPTGRALETSKAHSGSHPIKLYGSWFCPFVQRTWIVLLEKKIPHQYIEINPYRKDPWFLKLNPKGLVPTVVVSRPRNGRDTSQDAERNQQEDSEILVESSEICVYLDDHYDNMGSKKLASNDLAGQANLFPLEEEERERCEQSIEHINKEIIPLFYRVLQHQPHSPYSAEEASAQLRRNILWLLGEMHAHGPWFLGEKFSMVDVALIPWARRLWLIDHYKQHSSGIPLDHAVGAAASSELEEPQRKLWDRWRTWKSAVDARQSVLDTSSEDAHYILAYKRYAEDTTGSMVGKATRDGHALP